MRDRVLGPFIFAEKIIIFEYACNYVLSQIDGIVIEKKRSVIFNSDEAMFHCMKSSQ